MRGVVPRINIGTWGLCDRLCLVLVCRGRYGFGGVSSLHSWIEFGRSRTGEGSSGGRKRGMMIILLLFLQKQNLAFAVYLLGLVLSSPLL